LKTFLFQTKVYITREFARGKTFRNFFFRRNNEKIIQTIRRS